VSRLTDLASRIEAARQPSPPPPPVTLGARDLLEALRIHPVARRLPLAFDPVRLQADLTRIEESWWRGHLGPYHDGNWESVSLWSPRGDLLEQRSYGGAFAATEALTRCAYLREVMDAFPAEKNRVRLMRLQPGGQILRHSDPLHQIARDLVRIHVPVVTSPTVRFIVHGRRLVMEPGTAWLVDVRFPHEVHNPGTDSRVHLVLDLINSPALDALLHRSVVVGRGLLTGYYARHALPTGLRQRLGIGN
jgi:hypothetical protein